MACRHEFETNPLKIVTKRRNAGFEVERGVTKVFTADVPCVECGKNVDIRYGLMSIGHQE